MSAPSTPPEHLEQLPTERRLPASANLDQLSTLEMLRVINDEDAKVAAAVQAVLPQIALAVEAIADRFARGGRLFYLGAGTSGRLGVLDASECPPTFAVAPQLFTGLIAGGDTALRTSSEGSEDSAEEGTRDLADHHLTSNDAVLGIAASGRTPWVLGGLAEASRVGALTLALTCAGGAAQRSRMAHAVEIAIEVASGPEVLTGSTRLKAGTATKLVLNMISTGVMVRRGAVFGNLMVNVQLTNAKLVDRARRIIVDATGCDPERAAHLLEETNDVKTAILMEQRGLSHPAASARLDETEGNLRRALD
jgi:N-acetylmuramic acid 6-phosphate etherase